MTNEDKFTYLLKTITHAAYLLIPLNNTRKSSNVRPIWQDNEYTEIINQRKNATKKYVGLSYLENCI